VSRKTRRADQERSAERRRGHEERCCFAVLEGNSLIVITSLHITVSPAQPQLAKDIEDSLDSWSAPILSAKLEHSHRAFLETRSKKNRYQEMIAFFLFASKGRFPGHSKSSCSFRPGTFV